MRYVYAGNRDIGVKVLELLIAKGFYPELLMITDRESEEAKAMINLSKLDDRHIIVGRPDESEITELFANERPDYIFGIHYPYIIRKALLDLPKLGFLNLHPAYLPYNRGWHTPSWAILEDTPIGATLHMMSEELDMGDIISRKQLEVAISDTADSLYQKIKNLEVRLFEESIDQIINKNFTLVKQHKQEGSAHKRIELFDEKVAKLELDKDYNLEALLTKLRALTTNKISEAAYFTKNDKKYRIQVKITEE